MALSSCRVSQTISKRSVIGSFPEGSRTRIWLESLEEDQWSIDSFIPETGLVCATIVSKRNIVSYLALTLPILR